MTLYSPVPRPSGTPSPIFTNPDVEASCNADLICSRLKAWDAPAWLAESSYVLLVKPLRIVAIIALALLFRWLIHRAVRRLTSTSSKMGVPGILKPLRERIPTVAVESTAVVPERRKQRAEAIGSVLRSFVTAVIMTTAALFVLSELGFNLGPLLASAGIVGVAIGFGAQTLVKDLITGLFMLIEDQYGVGDTVDLGEATGVVEAVGLRITTVRDGRGVLWYIRNGEIVRVGNKSQGWAMVVIDLPVGFVSVEQATSVLQQAALSVAEDAEFATQFLEPPDVLGVEQMTVDGAVIRTIAKTTADGQFPVQRELRRALTEALESSGIAERIAASRMFPRPAAPPNGGTPAGAT